jgi:hypothetical protein
MLEQNLYPIAQFGSLGGPTIAIPKMSNGCKSLPVIKHVRDEKLLEVWFIPYPIMVDKSLLLMNFVIFRLLKKEKRFSTFEKNFSFLDSHDAVKKWADFFAPQA